MRYIDSHFTYLLYLLSTTGTQRFLLFDKLECREEKNAAR